MISPPKKLKITKIDAIIVVVLIVIAGIVLVRSGTISPELEEIITPPSEQKQPGETIEQIPEPIIPPESIIPGYMRSVSPEDEGLHYDKFSVSREWWYYGVVFDQNSDLAGWSASISFNHMARSDLLGTSKPDMMIVTIHGPNGEEYGGVINKERGLGILKQPTLQAKTPGVSVTFENSWAEGEAPEWFVHVEDDDIDQNHVIILDLRFFAPFDAIWTIGENAFDKTNRNLASYVFLSCNVTGSITIDGDSYTVHGNGHHEHTWSPHLVTKGLINGWDWTHITFDNGWNLYFTSYYNTPQYISTKTPDINPFGSLIITTDEGDTLTILNNIHPEIVTSDKEIFTFVSMPQEISLNAQPSFTQPLLNTFDISLNIDIGFDNSYEKIWKFPTYVGMKIGRNLVSGTLTWNDDEGEHTIDLNGIGTMWSMRAFL
jgi:hypothetical protein